MPVSVPPPEALAEFLGPTTRHTRRIEIYESDGLTRWKGDTIGRLKSGSVTVDYDRDERRALDLVLSNDDHGLLNAPGQLWYDKIIKVFRGVRVNAKRTLPKILVITDSTTDPAGASFRAAAANLGFGDVQINTIALSYFIDIAPYDIVVALGDQDKGALLNQAYLAGKAVFAFRRGAEYFLNAMLGTSSWGGETRDLSNKIERRRNYLRNGGANANATDWGSNAGTSGAGTMAWNSGTGALSAGFVRYTWTTATTSTSNAGLYVSTEPSVVTPNYWTASLYVRPSIAQTMRLGVEFKSATATLKTVLGPDTVCAANVWTRISCPNALAGAGTTQATMTAYNNGVVWPVNATLDASNALLEKGAEVLNYFDGSTTDTKTMDYQWTGAANASISIMASGFVTTRKNWVANGRPGTVTGWSGNSGTSGASTLALRTDGSPSGNNYIRRVWTTASTSTTGGNFVGTTASNAVYEIPVVPGERIAYQIFGRCNKSQRIYTYITYYNAAGTSVGNSTTLTKVVNANEWTEFSAGDLTVPANAARCIILMYAVAGTGASTWAVNDYLDTCGALVERNVAAGYVPIKTFDGANPNDVDFVYEWEGTAYQSDGLERELDPARIVPLGNTDPRTAAWSGFYPIGTAETYKAPLASIPQTFNVALSNSALSTSITSAENSVGGRYIGVHFPLTPYQYTDPNFMQFMFASLDWLNPIKPLELWEVQIGEFMIDRITEPHFPYEVRITGRDYTKKCKLSKFSEATQFEEGLLLEDLIAAIAGNAGIRKMLLPKTNITIGQTFFFERGTARWEAMKEIATAYNHEIFFDATGYLVIRPFRDPSKTAPALYIQTGKEGQIGSYEKSTSDSELYNHVLVSGESSDATLIPVYAEARNTDPKSPTRIEAIGDRYWEFVSAFVETEAQAQELANSYLAIHSLEEFELSFETLMLPWTEVGDILGWSDPNPAPGDPTTFLLSSISLPLNLAPMSGVGRRVTIVG